MDEKEFKLIEKISIDEIKKQLIEKEIKQFEQQILHITQLIRRRKKNDLAYHTIDIISNFLEKIYPNKSIFINFMLTIFFYKTIPENASKEEIFNEIQKYKDIIENNL